MPIDILVAVLHSTYVYSSLRTEIFFSPFPASDFCACLIQWGPLYFVFSWYIWSWWKRASRGTASQERKGKETIVTFNILTSFGTKSQQSWNDLSKNWFLVPVHFGCRRILTLYYYFFFFFFSNELRCELLDANLFQLAW